MTPTLLRFFKATAASIAVLAVSLGTIAVMTIVVRLLVDSVGPFGIIIFAAAVSAFVGALFVFFSPWGRS